MLKFIRYRAVIAPGAAQHADTISHGCARLCDSHECLMDSVSIGVNSVAQASWSAHGTRDLVYGLVLGIEDEVSWDVGGSRRSHNSSGRY